MISQPRVEWVPNTVAESGKPCTRALGRLRDPRGGRIAALTLLKWHRLFLLLRTGTRVAQQKTRRGLPPGLRHNSHGYRFVVESRCIVKDSSRARAV